MIQYKEESRGVISVPLYEQAECKAIVDEIKRYQGWTAALVRDAKDALNYEVLTRPDVRSASTLATVDAEKFHHQFEGRIDATLIPLVNRHWQVNLANHSGTHILKYGPAD